MNLRQIKYTWGEGTEQTEIKHGAEYGTTTTLDLDDDEFITGVEGYSNNYHVTQLVFITNKSLMRFLVSSFNAEMEQLTLEVI